MKSNKKIFAVAALATAVGFSAQAQSKWAKGQILVAPKPGVSQESFDKLLSKHNGKSKFKFKSANVYLINVPINAEKGIVNALSKNPKVDFAELDELVKPSEIHANDTYYSSGWHLSKLNMPSAWMKSKGEDVVVAVLDTGVNASVTDLSGQVLPGRNVDSDNNSVTDVYGHGTRVAGVIAANSNNSTGVTSVAWNAKILPIKITDSADGWASSSDIAKGINWAADNGADIVNISYSQSSSSTIATAAKNFHARGGLVVMSAGNNGDLLSCTQSNEIIVVSATTSSDAKASWSNYGPCIDVSAPGDRIYTTTASGSYGAVSGTSFSAPMTAAVLALMKAKNPSLSNVQLESALKSSANKAMFSGSYSNLYGYGRIDANAALDEISAEVPIVDQTPPQVTIISPANNSEHNENVSVEVSASDNVGVTKVELFIDNQLVATDSIAPYSFNIDTSMYTEQQVQLEAIAFDAENNIGNSETYQLSILNITEPEPEPEPEPGDSQAPSISIDNPVNGSSITSNQTVRVRASDNVAVTRTELYINNTLVASVNGSSLDYSWNVKKAATGNHAIKAMAFDAAGNVNQQNITVTKAEDSKGGGKGNGKGKP